MAQVDFYTDDLGDEIDISVWRGSKVMLGGIDSYLTRHYNSDELKKQLLDLWERYSDGGITEVTATSRSDGSLIASIKSSESSKPWYKIPWQSRKV